MSNYIYFYTAVAIVIASSACIYTFSYLENPLTHHSYNIKNPEESIRQQVYRQWLKRMSDLANRSKK